MTTLKPLPVWLKILSVHEDGDTISRLARKTNACISHVSREVELLRLRGLVTKEETGRSTRTRLTLNGLLVKGACLVIESSTVNQ